jgi:Zn-dependent M28 family amino/carboxypeptidase
MDVFGGTLGDPVMIPVFGTTFAIGQNLIANPTVLLHMVALVKYGWVGVSNIIAETRTGDPNSVIIVGSHYDSVSAGPGVNDNGSGTSTNLELAIQYFTATKSKAIKPQNRVRFAWWAAEEEGLIGAYYYVDSLIAANTLNLVQMNLNFDMLGSPNFIYGVFNGSSGDYVPRVIAGASIIQSVFEDYFQTQSIPYLLTEFDGRSDYGPFIEADVAANGLETGAEVFKSVEQRHMFGGLANTAYDPCYHQSCDTVENISQESLLTMAQTAAFALDFFASQTNLHDFLYGIEDKGLVTDSTLLSTSPERRTRTLNRAPSRGVRVRGPRSRSH